MYRSSKSRKKICLTFFTWWPEMTLTCIMVTKHRKWYLQMSVTLSMPIHWLCLRLTSKFYSPMSPSPKSRKFWLWPDLWRHQWPAGQIFDLLRVVHVQGYNEIVCARKTTNLQTTTYKVLWKRLQVGATTSDSQAVSSVRNSREAPRQMMTKSCFTQLQKRFSLPNENSTQKAGICQSLWDRCF